MLLALKQLAGIETRSPGKWKRPHRTWATTLEALERRGLISLRHRHPGGLEARITKAGVAYLKEIE